MWYLINLCTNLQIMIQCLVISIQKEPYFNEVKNKCYVCLVIFY